jgi:prevent-host-death family protein
MDTVGTFEAKTHLTRLLDRVAAGEQVTITRHGTPVARLVPVKPAGSRQPPRDHCQAQRVQLRSNAWRSQNQGLDQRGSTLTGFVIDASVALAWRFDEATARTRALLDRFEDDHAEAPALWHLELANALAVRERNKRIMPARSSEFIALIGGLPIVVDEQTPSFALGTGSVVQFIECYPTVKRQPVASTR